MRRVVVVVAVMVAVVATVVDAAASRAGGEPVLNRRATMPAMTSDTHMTQLEKHFQAILSTMAENQLQLQATLQELTRVAQRTQTDVRELRDDTDLVLDKMYKSSCQQIAEGLPDHRAGQSQPTTEGVYTIKPHRFKPVKVRCELGRGAVGWTVVLSRDNGREPFNRTYKEYQDGFGDPSQDHFIGLDVLHRLTTWQPQQLRAVMEDWDGAKTWVQYNVFRVAGSDDNYRLSVDQFEADSAAGDGLSIHNGKVFSTYDKDGDNNPNANCATVMGGGGGWWYDNCYHVLPTGTYRSVGGNTYGGVAWYPWRNVKHSLKSLTLLIKPRD